RQHDVLLLISRWRVAHPALHSFPTRRSSDLAFRDAVRCTIYATAPEDPRPFLSSVLAEFHPGRLRLVGTDINRLVVKDIGIEGRSEEHTSELQSRENLVCRLLLEKKNRNYGE